jgi:hypothetical protein
VWVTFDILCMHAYDGWACSMKVHASRWEVLGPVVTEVFYLKFEPAKKDRIITKWMDFSSMNELCKWIVHPWMNYANELFIHEWIMEPNR